MAPSQYDLSLVGRSNTNTTITSKGSLYSTHLYLNIFYLLLLFVVTAFCFSSYLLRPTLVHIGIKGGSTAGSRDNGHASIYIFFLFRVPHELVIGESCSCEHTHIYK